MNTKKVVIVGAGIVGLSTAYYLNKKGLQVEVIDQSEGNDNCSFGNAGYVAPSHLIPLASPGIISQGLKWMLNSKSPFYIKPRLDVDLLKWGWLFKKASTSKRVREAVPVLYQLTTQSQLLYEQIIQEEGLDAGYQKPGLLMVCQTHKGLEHEMELLEFAKNMGLPAEKLTTHETERIEPHIKYDSVGSLFFECDAWMTPHVFMKAFENILKQKGVVIRHQTVVEDFLQKNQQIVGLNTSDGMLKGDHYVITAGAWTSSLMKKLGVSVPLQGGKGYSFMMAPSQSPTFPSILVEGRIATSPMLDGLRIAGTMELSGINHTIGQQRVEGIIENVKKAIPQYQSYDFSSIKPWAGLRPCSPDGLPYIGKTRAANNLTVGTGHAMLGWTLGPITGQLIAQSLLNEPLAINSPLLAVDRYN